MLGFLFSILQERCGLLVVLRFVWSALCPRRPIFWWCARPCGRVCSLIEIWTYVVVILVFEWWVVFRLKDKLLDDLQKCSCELSFDTFHVFWDVICFNKCFCFGFIWERMSFFPSFFIFGLILSIGCQLILRFMWLEMWILVFMELCSGGVP